MDKKLLKEEYKRLLTKAIEGRPGGMALMIMLEETDFYNSPASAKHHLNVPGGLVMHSLNVAKAALELCENMPQFAGCDKNAVLTAAEITSRNRMEAISIEIRICWGTVKRP